MNALKRLNDALPMLCITILGYGVIAELIGVWFTEDKLRYTTGLLIGIACAEFMAVHLAIVIRDAVESGAADGNTKMLSVKSVLRYFIVAVVVIGATALNLGNPIAIFIGLLGLKIAAYVQLPIAKLLGLETYRWDATAQEGAAPESEGQSGTSTDPDTENQS